MATSQRFKVGQQDYIEQLNLMDDQLNTAGGGTEFASSVFRVKDGTDPTKKVAFDLSGLPTATTRTFIVPNANATLAALGVAQTFTATQTFSASGIKINGSISGALTLAAPAAAGSGTVTFPASGTLATIDGTQTMSGAFTFSNTINGSVSGNAGTATKLATARTINGASFDGSANISFNSDAVAEGSTNLWYTNARARGAITLTAGSSGATYSSATGVLDLSALTGGSGTFPPTGNPYGFQTPVLPYFTETPVAAGTTATAPVCDFITTISSDGDGTGNTHQDWAGLQREIICRMGDGTLFMAYIQNNAGTDRLRLMRSPTGGSTSGGTWTQVTTVATDMYKSILLRDRSRDHLFWITAEGTTPNYSLKIRVFNSAGTQVGSTYTVQTAGTAFMKQITNQGFYYEAGVGPTGRVVLAGWQLPDPSSAVAANTTTLSCYKTYQWLFWDGTNWTQEPFGKFYVGERADYDNVIVGVNGDDDQVFGIAQGNVALWEAVCDLYADRLSQERLTGFYAFHKFIVWWHNRRTGENGWRVVSPPVPWQIRPWDGTGGLYDAAKDIPEARTKQALYNWVTGDWWIPYRYTQPKPYAAGMTFTASIAASGGQTVMTVTSTPTNSGSITVGTTITGHSLATTGMLATKVIGGSGTGGTGSYILDIPHSLASGTVSACNVSTPSTAVSPTSHIRVMIVSPKGEIKWDGLVLDATFGQVGLHMTSTGRVYMNLIALGGTTQQTFFHMWELTRAADGSINTVALGASNTLNSNNIPTGNVGFGTVTTYYSGAATLPARASNQGPIYPDVHHGSKPVTNTFDLLVSRRATDHNAGGTLTTVGDDTGHKMDIMRIRVPH